MTDETPLLRADALDEEDLGYGEATQQEPIVVDGVLTGEVNEPLPATAPVVNDDPPVYEPYENSEGGWSYR